VAVVTRVRPSESGTQQRVPADRDPSEAMTSDQVSAADRWFSETKKECSQARQDARKDAGSFFQITRNLYGWGDEFLSKNIDDSTEIGVRKISIVGIAPDDAMYGQACRNSIAERFIETLHHWAKELPEGLGVDTFRGNVKRASRKEVGERFRLMVHDFINSRFEGRRDCTWLYLDTEEEKAKHGLGSATTTRLESVQRNATASTVTAESAANVNDPLNWFCIPSAWKTLVERQKQNSHGASLSTSFEASQAVHIDVPIAATAFQDSNGKPLTDSAFQVVFPISHSRALDWWPYAQAFFNSDMLAEIDSADDCESRLQLQVDSINRKLVELNCLSVARDHSPKPLKWERACATPGTYIGFAAHMLHGAVSIGTMEEQNNIKGDWTIKLAMHMYFAPKEVNDFVNGYDHAQRTAAVDWEYTDYNDKLPKAGKRKSSKNGSDADRASDRDQAKQDAANIFAAHWVKHRAATTQSQYGPEAAHRDGDMAASCSVAVSDPASPAVPESLKLAAEAADEEMQNLKLWAGIESSTVDILSNHPYLWDTIATVSGAPGPVSVRRQLSQCPEESLDGWLEAAYYPVDR
jgi:hypothetical protein